MRKNLLKSLFVVVAFVAGTNYAVADEINATLDHTAGAQWGSNTGASTVDAEKEHYNNDAAGSWAGCAYAQFSYQIPEGHSVTKAELTYYVNQGGRASRNDIIYYMKKDFTIDYDTFAGQTGKDLRYTSDRSGKAVASAPTGGTGDRGPLTFDVTDAVKDIAGQGQSYIIFQWTGNAGGADLYGKGSAEKAPALVITTADASSQTTYTVEFTDGTAAIKDPVVYDGTIGETATASAEDMAPFKVNDKKYIYESGNKTITLVKEPANNVITLVFSEAPKYNYSVKSNLGTTIVEGEDFYGETVVAYYPHYIMVEDSLYNCPKQGSNPWYGISFVLEDPDTEETVEYSKTDIGSIVFYSEGEALEGATASNSNFADIRSFGGAVGFADAEDVEITTLEPGVYILTADLFTPTSAMGSSKFSVGEETFTLTSTSNGYHNELSTAEFEVKSTVTVKLLAGGSKTNAIDWLYIKKTAGVATGITSVAAKSENAVKNEVFNLNGQRVAAPVKGLYIVNGKKVILK